ncbi:MAG: class I SAM-dependent methyltransferase [Candidatus Omnitrophica bacterium]|nr:class I SAM-dependent methyltransferase [Candidatus Omnitrophota bacterium]
MSGIFDRHTERYDAWYDKNKFVYLSELGAIKRALPKKGKGLEIGVGTGRFAAPLAIQYGVDPSKNMLKFARRRDINVRRGVGEKLPYASATFDYVAIIITLCFVKDPRLVLSEARRVLKKNGRIIIGMVDRESFLGKIYQRKKSVFYKQARFFSVNEVADLLKEAGFASFSYYQAIFALFDKISRLEKPRKGFGKGGFVVISARKGLLRKIT